MPGHTARAARSGWLLAACSLQSVAAAAQRKASLVQDGTHETTYQGLSIAGARAQRDSLAFRSGQPWRRLY